MKTRLIHAGRNQQASGPHGVSVPVTRLSTVLFDDIEQMRDAQDRRDDERVLSYGARGNPTAFALEDLVTELEGGYRSKLFVTGMAAIAQVFLAYLRPGEHVLITEGVYSPVRRLAREFLQPFGIEVDYYPADGHGLASMIKPTTRMIYAETPSSLLYEIVDLPAIARLCKTRSILLAVDSTWGGGYLYQPLSLGADISIMALSKYLSGHSDTMMGSVCTTEAAFMPLSRMSDTFGSTVSPDDAWLILRGARTLACRLETHGRQALEVAQWLEDRVEVARVYYPALATHVGHELWLRDFQGCNGLLTFEFATASLHQVHTFVEALQLFGLGASWGGFESLVCPVNLSERSTRYPTGGNLLRLHIGLEAVHSLIADLDRGFRALC